MRGTPKTVGKGGNGQSRTRIEGERTEVPTGYAAFPREILRPPRSVAELSDADIRRWTTMDKGGHFAALEQPEVLAHEIREFFRPLRQPARSTGRQA